MYDPFTSRYAFACPTRGETHVLLSAFRSIEQLPGAAHPAVFRVRFDCACGEEHDGLVTHDDLDWAPLGLGAGEFLNLMTARLEPAGGELEEALVVLAQRVGGEGVEPRRELRVRALEQGGPLLRAFPLVGELHAQGGVTGAHDEPDDAGAEDEADEEADDHWADER